MAAAVNRFAFDFYGKLREKPGNLFVSPLSLHAALSMTAAGADGRTLDELRKVLHLPAESDAGYANLLAATVGIRPGYQLRTANAVWGQTGYPWKRPFLDRLTAGFGAELKEADYKSQADAERVRINQWAEGQTAGRIKELLDPGSLGAHTRMVLVNALYFKGEWDERFDDRLTRSLPFTRADGTKEDVPTMCRDRGYRLYTEWLAGQGQPSFWVAALPYKGGEAELVLIVPGRHDGLPAVEVKLTPEALGGWLADARVEKQLELYLPKFKLETEFEEKQANAGPLHALGIASVFDPDRADLSAMHSSGEQLFVDFVKQKVIVEVNEEGTEAAAATAAVFTQVSATLPYRADRPFVFLLRHRPTGAVLFLGRYAGP